MFEDRGSEDLMNKAVLTNRLRAEQRIIMSNKRVIVIAVSVQCEQWHESSVKKRKSLTDTKHTHIKTFLKDKIVTIL